MNTAKKIPAIVLGGTGYVAGEMLRLIATHPNFELRAAVSESQSGTAIKDVFPHLQQALGTSAYIDQPQLADVFGALSGEKVALFAAAPHGASAALIANTLRTARDKGVDMHVVDASADFRFTSNDAYQAVYGHSHGAPELLGSFASVLPEHAEKATTRHIGHPGCFATAMLLGAVPLLKLLPEATSIAAFGITGSTGSGRTPIATTHHPVRHSNLYAYKPLSHRHAPEVEHICAAVTGVTPTLSFIPHSGPFARGIHMTLQVNAASTPSAAELQAAFEEFYATHDFVEVVAGTPRIKNVAGSNYAHIGTTADGNTAAVFVAIDNLVKGAAGGCVQWMNRLFDLPEASGLTMPGPGWI